VATGDLGNILVCVGCALGGGGGDLPALSLSLKAGWVGHRLLGNRLRGNR